MSRYPEGFSGHFSGHCIRDRYFKSHRSAFTHHHRPVLAGRAGNEPRHRQMVAHGPDAVADARAHRVEPRKSAAVCAKGGSGTGLIPALVIFPVYFPPVPVNRYAPFGTVISNRAPLPGTPFPVIVMPVIARISRERNNPSPVFFPKPRVKSRFFSSALTPGTDDD